MKRSLLRILIKLAAAFVAYVVGLLAWRPWHRRWGATDEEVVKPLPGDEFASRGPSCIHAITIRAPRSVVWKWMVQIGPLLKVMAVEKDHYLVLDRWGAFVLEEIDANTTRFIIRSHEGNPMGGRLLNVLFWEPAHFIMEYGMTGGVRREERHRRPKIFRTVRRSDSRSCGSSAPSFN